MTLPCTNAPVPSETARKWLPLFERLIFQFQRPPVDLALLAAVSDSAKALSSP